MPDTSPVIPVADLEQSLTPEELTLARLADLNVRCSSLQRDMDILFSLVAKLGELKGAKLKQRQTDKGWMLYWEDQGRIVLP